MPLPGLENQRHALREEIRNVSVEAATFRAAFESLSVRLQRLQRIALLEDEDGGAATPPSLEVAGDEGKSEGCRELERLFSIPEARESCRADPLAVVLGVDSNIDSGRSPAARASKQSNATTASHSKTTHGAQETEEFQLLGQWTELRLANDGALGLMEVRAQKNTAQKNQLRKKQSPTMLSISFHPSSSVSLLPHSKVRISWDVVGAALLLSDVVMVPYMAAWRVDIDVPSALFFLLVITSVFWLVDIILNCKTGFYRDGVLVTDGREAVMNYARTYMAFDLVCIVLDLFVVAVPDSSSDLNVLRGMRFLRMLRLMRVAKFGRLSQALEDACSAPSYQWIVLVVALVKIFIGLLVGAHLLACAWYWIGSAGPPGRNWIDQRRAQSKSERYMQALYWVLCQFTSPSVAQQNGLETAFAGFVILFVLLVLGSCISKLTTTLSQLNRWNSEGAQRRRQLRQYLVRSQVPMELSVRIMQFVDNELLREANSIMEATALNMLSKQLRAELHVLQRGPHLAACPLFALVQATLPEVFLEVCGALSARIFEQSQVVFAAGTWAQCMYITVHGKYKLQVDPCGRRPNGEIVEFNDNQAQFAEISLFSPFLHTSTLTAGTVADAFTLCSADFLEAVQSSPVCVETICDYADTLFRGLHRGKWGVACHDHLPHHAVAEACALTRLARRASEQQRGPTPRLLPMDSCLAPMSGVQLLTGEQVRCFARRAIAAEPPQGNEAILEELPLVFPELDPDHGVYAQLVHLEERARVLCSLTSVFCLVGGRYEAFVCPQEPARRMTRELWAELQSFGLWGADDEHALHGVLVFLVVRGLGKSKSFASLVPPEQRTTPESIVMHAMGDLPGLLPSAQELSEEAVELVRDTFSVNTQFNLAQFLQGENLPAHVQALQRVLRHGGERQLKFYLFAMVAMMSGLFGVTQQRGSDFMDQANGGNIVLVIRSLLQMSVWSAERAYWTYIWSRGERLGLCARHIEHFALARLLCLARVSSPEDLTQLREVWHALSANDRRLLTDHLVLKGSNQKAVAFVFLPLFLTNAWSNPAIGLLQALCTLAEVAEMVSMHCLVDQVHSKSIRVELSDLAAFAHEVHIRHVFEACVDHSRLVRVGSTMRLVMTSKNWNRVRSAAAAEDRATDLTHMVKQVSKRQQAIQHSLGALLRSSRPSVGLPERPPGSERSRDRPPALAAEAAAPAAAGRAEPATIERAASARDCGVPRALSSTHRAAVVSLPGSLLDANDIHIAM